MFLPLTGLFLAGPGGPTSAQETQSVCTDLRNESGLYTACRFDPETVDIRLHLADPDG
jgi:uncharacterized protein YigE (DUF2233 family)